MAANCGKLSYGQTALYKGYNMASPSIDDFGKERRVLDTTINGLCVSTVRFQTYPLYCQITNLQSNQIN